MKRFSFFILSLFALSCAHNPEAPIINDKALRATSWSQIPILIEQAIEQKNVALYDSLLADEFVFYFDPLDIDRNPNLKPSWDKDREMRSIQGLFNDPNIGAISIDWSVGSLKESPSSRSNGRVVLSDLRMAVPKMGTCAGVDTLKVGGEFLLDLKEMPILDEYGNNVWKIVGWWERAKQVKLVPPAPQSIQMVPIPEKRKEEIPKRTTNK